MRPDALDNVGCWDLEVKAAHSEGGGHGSLLMIEKFLNVQIGLLPPAHRGIFWSLKVAQKFSLAIHKQISLEPFLISSQTMSESLMASGCRGKRDG